jgi:hypothetical protein
VGTAERIVSSWYIFWQCLSVLLKETRKNFGLVGVSVEIRVVTSINTSVLTHSVIKSWGFKDILALRQPYAFSSEWNSSAGLCSQDEVKRRNLVHRAKYASGTRQYSGPLTYELNSFQRAGRNSSWS